MSRLFANSVKALTFHRVAHKSNARNLDYPGAPLSLFATVKPDISPDRRWRIQMRTIIFIVLTAMIGVGAVNAAPLDNPPAAPQQESSANWANG